jgi:hypothetical protein
MRVILGDFFYNKESPIDFISENVMRILSGYPIRIGSYPGDYNAYNNEENLAFIKKIKENAKQLFNEFGLGITIQE